MVMQQNLPTAWRGGHFSGIDSRGIVMAGGASVAAGASTAREADTSVAALFFLPGETHLVRDLRAILIMAL